tara:strand:+ start:65 stop:301 length:237 start_codon:yes stop_codon:yes gene_type:complete
MNKKGYKQCKPMNNNIEESEQDMLGFSSGYLSRAIDILPKQGIKSPWKNYQNYLIDIFDTRLGSFKDGALKFTTIEKV